MGGEVRKLIVAITCFLALLAAGCDATQPGPEKASAASTESAMKRQTVSEKRQALKRQAQRRAARTKAARVERRRRAERRRAAARHRRAAMRRAARREAKRRAAEEVRIKAEAEPEIADCHPSYEGACLDPSISDYDCAGGSGDGPAYTGPVRVVGPDDYDLDRDGDGYACE